METINNLASAASKAVFGTAENKEEPLSGAQGDPSKGEPFDKGNLEPSEVDKQSANDTPSDSKKDTTSNAGPTTTKDSSVVKEDSTKGQNDVRSPSDPTTSQKHAEDAKNVDDSGEGINDVKVDGPGPKPIAEVAREHGGDAGNANKEPASAPTPDAASGGKPKTGSGEDDDGPQTVSHGEGTGEKYVKSNGLQADGGNFDAAQPGAGREADRLLEEKGIHTQQNPPSHKKEDNVPPTTATDGHPKVDTTANHTKNGNIMSGGSPESKEKRKLGDRIKAKLHIHKGTPA